VASFSSFRVPTGQICPRRGDGGRGFFPSPSKARAFGSPPGSFFASPSLARLFPLLSGHDNGNRPFVLPFWRIFFLQQPAPPSLTWRLRVLLSRNCIYPPSPLPGALALLNDLRKFLFGHGPAFVSFLPLSFQSSDETARKMRYAASTRGSREAVCSVTTPSMFFKLTKFSVFSPSRSFNMPTLFFFPARRF